MNDVERMLIEHECSKLMTLYCQHLDHEDAEGFAGIYAEDAMYKPAALPEPMYGRQAILDWAKAYPKDRLGRHFSTNQVVEVVDEDHAIGRSYAVVFREPEPRQGVLSDRVTPRSVVEYFDEFGRTAEGWRISSRYYQVQFMQDEETVRPLPWTP
jgi:SnoaL-like protein